MSLPVYSSRDVKLSWAGVALDGLAPDSFITFSRASDITDEEVGADGSLSISKLPDRTGTCTVTLQQQSTGNKILAGMIGEQEAGSSLYVGTLEVRDPSGSVLADLSMAHIKTTPEVDYGSSATGSNRAWVFFVEHMKFTDSPQGDSDNPVVAAQQAAVEAAIVSIKGTALDAISDVIGSL
jgi:hypothetical protein